MNGWTSIYNNMEYYNIKGIEVPTFRTAKGNYAGKYNRMMKLIANYDKIESKMYGIAARGLQTNSLNARLAIAVLLMMNTGIRVGNEDSAEGYMTKPHPNSKEKARFTQTYGLTTLQLRHMRVRNGKVYLNFIGKKSVENSFVVGEPLSTYLIPMKDMRRAEGCFSDDTLFDITAYELTKFIKLHVGKNFSPKDFRCMMANITAGISLERHLVEYGDELMTKSDKRKLWKNIREDVAEQLNNTPAVCGRSYIDSNMLDYINEL